MVCRIVTTKSFLLAGFPAAENSQLSSIPLLNRIYLSSLVIFSILIMSYFYFQPFGGVAESAKKSLNDHMILKTF